MSEDLFRKEALDAQSASNDIFGRPTGVVPPAWTWMTWLLGLFITALLVFLLTANFARKETVRGKLRPVGTEAKIYAQDPGLVANVHVQDGAQVLEGQPLVSITSDRTLSDGAKLSEDALAALQKESDLLALRLENLKESASIAEDDLDQRIADARRRAREGNRQLAALRERIGRAEQRAKDTEDFLAEGLITAPEHMRRVDELAAFEEGELRLEAEIGAAEAEQSALAIERRRIQFELEQNTADFAQRLSQIEAQIRQTEANAEYVLTAPFSGRVYSLQARPGERADPSLPLLTVGPNEAELIAELYLPTRAIAFVEPGDQVNLQYDAFPYQKFGIARGDVLRVSANALFPQELGVITQVPEPLYRVDVALAKQSMRAFGNETALQSGMELSADIVLEDRKLFEWLLEPLRSVR